jgi:hypothetical protein
VQQRSNKLPQQQMEQHVANVFWSFDALEDVNDLDSLSFDGRRKMRAEQQLNANVDPSAFGSSFGDHLFSK